MATSATRGDNAHRIVPDGPRAQAPIRWPHPDRLTLALFGLWLIGLLVALFVPALIVPPSASAAEAGRVWTAFGFTVLGSGVMIAAAVGLRRRSGEAGILVLGLVPAASCVMGGLIIAASKLS